MALMVPALSSCLRLSRGVFLAVNPFSMYSTTNAVHHDLKRPLVRSLPPVVGSGPGGGGAGFSVNQRDTRGLLRIEDDEAPSLTIARASFTEGCSLRAEADRHRNEVDGEMAAVVAAAASAPWRSSGHSNNVKAFQPPLPPPKERPPVELARVLMGTKDPVARENDFTGPSPWSLTSRTHFRPHRVTDVECLSAAGAAIDFRRQPAANGAVRNNQSAPPAPLAPLPGTRTTEQREFCGRQLDSSPPSVATDGAGARLYVKMRDLRDCAPNGGAPPLPPDPDRCISTYRIACRDAEVPPRGARVACDTGFSRNSSLVAGSGADQPIEAPRRLRGDQEAVAGSRRRLELEGDVRVSMYRSEFAVPRRPARPSGPGTALVGNGTAYGLPPGSLLREQHAEDPSSPTFQRTHPSVLRLLRKSSEARAGGR